jgi:hypothetical protein
MAQFYRLPAGDGMIVYVERLMAGTAMLTSIILSLDAIRRRDFKTHGDWMIRAYAIALGAGTQVFTHIPWFVLVDTHPGKFPRGVMMGAGWLINVVVAEWIIRSSRVTRTSRQAAVDSRASALPTALKEVSDAPKHPSRPSAHRTLHGRTLVRSSALGRASRAAAVDALPGPVAGRPDDRVRISG